MRVAVALIVVGGALLAPLAARTQGTSVLSPAEERGREIYLTGESPAGRPITAWLGDDRLELPGTAAVCGSCHGHDGSGRPESGVLPSNITWTFLTRSYGHRHESGLEHPPFDEASLARYLRTGLYPNGERGDPFMPVYEMADEDLADLIAYLKRVGEVLDPGVTEDAVRIGTLIPAGGPLGEIGSVIRDVLAAHFADVNAKGGVFGRRLELVVREIPAEEGGPEWVAAWLEEARPFALVSPFTPRLDRDLEALVAAPGVPLIGPFTLYSAQSFALDRQVYYVYPGLGEQLAALVHFTADELGLEQPRLAVVYPRDTPPEEAIETLEEAVSRRGWPPLLRETFPAGGLDAAAMVARLRDAGADGIVSLVVEPELRSLLAAAEATGWAPHVLAPGVLSGGVLFEVSPSFRQRLYVAYPTLPQDRQAWALARVAKLLGDHPRARSHLQAVVSAFAASEVLVEGLRRAGRSLSRRELTAALEKLYRFETGLTPPVTFTANRRVGARGAYILAPDSLVDGRLPAAVEWVEAE